MPETVAQEAFQRLMHSLKEQSALPEAMAEQQVSVSNTTYDLPDPSMVVWSELRGQPV